MPSSAALYRFGHSRRTDHAVAMRAEKHSSVQPRTEPFLSRNGGCYRAQVFSTIGPGSPRNSFWPATGPARLPPVLDDCTLLDGLIVVEDTTLAIDEAGNNG